MWCTYFANSYLPSIHLARFVISSLILRVICLPPNRTYTSPCIGSPSFLSQFWMLALYSMHTTKVFLYIRNILSSYSYLPFNPLRVRTWYITTSPCFPHSLHVLAVRLSVRLSNGVLNKYGRFRTLQAHSPFCEQNFRCKILCTSFHPFYL